MRLLLRTSFLVACALLFSANIARAAISVAQLDTTTATGSNSGFTSWAVLPNTADSTAYTNNVFVNYAANISNYFQPENNYGAVPSPNGSLAESFQATTGGAVTDIQIIVSGSIQGISLNLALYDAGVAPGSPTLVDTGSNSYSPGSSGVSNNLLTNGTGIALPGYNVSGANAAILDFQLSAEDSVNLTAGDEYVFEVSNPSSALIWFRMISPTPVNDNYPQGQAFRARGSLNGNPARDMSLAVTVAVPEPGALVLMGLAMPALAWAARRRNKIAA